MKKLLLALGFFACPLSGLAAGPVYQNVIFVASAPSGACTNGQPAQIVISTGALYTCQASVWGQWGTGGGTTGAALTMDNSGSGAASGTIFDGSVARTISYNTIGAFPTTSGTLTGNLIVQPTSGISDIKLFGQGSYAANYVQLFEDSGFVGINANEELNIYNSGGAIFIGSGQELYLDGAGGGYGIQIGTQHSNEPVGIGSASSTTTIGGPLQLSAALNPLAARKGTFTCTAAGTITISNTNEAVTSDVIISLNTAGGTISTPPAMKTVTASTGFTVLCGAADASVYNYDILN